MNRNTTWWLVVPKPQAQLNIDSVLRLSFEHIGKRLDQTMMARYGLPTKLDSWQQKPLAIKVVKAWQDCLYHTDYGLIVSDRMATILAQHPSDCQSLSLNVHYRGKSSPSPYFVVNVFLAPDCMNYTKSNAHFHEYIWNIRIENVDFDILAHKAHPAIIDPTRIPEGARVIVPKHTSDIFLHDEVAQRILKLKPTGMKLVPAQVSVETPAERAKVMRALAAVRRKWEPRIEEAKKLAALSLSEALGIAIAPACEAQLREFAGTIRKHGEVFDLREMVRETQSMRKATDILWPHHFICVGNDGRGGVFAVDTSKARTDSGPVVYSDHELMQEQAGKLVPQLEYAADSLAAWVAKNCRTPKLR